MADLNKLKLADHLEKLSYFQAVAKYKSFYRASMILSVAQSTLSHSIKTLEENIEKSLFVRQPRGVQLTREGESLLQLTHDLFSLVDKFENDTLTKASEVRGTIRIGLYGALARWVLAPIIKTIDSEYSFIDFQVDTEKSNTLMFEKLLLKELDFVIAGSPRAFRGVEQVILHNEAYAFYIAPKLLKKLNRNLKMNSETSFSLSQMADLPFLLFAEAIAGVDDRLDRVLIRQSLDFKKIHRINDFEVIKDFTAQGLGFSILPTRTVSEEVTRGRLEQISIKGVSKKTLGQNNICLCYQKERKVEPLISLLLSVI